MRTSGTAPVFKTPARNTPSGRMWLTIVLTICLPPIGMMLLWHGARCPLRGKILISLIGFASLTVMLVYILGLNNSDTVELTQGVVTYQYGTMATETPQAQAGEATDPRARRAGGCGFNRRLGYRGSNSRRARNLRLFTCRFACAAHVFA